MAPIADDTPGSSRAARKGQLQVQNPGANPGAPARRTKSHHRRVDGRAGAPWGRWAAEVRVPGTRDRLWIGKFDHALQAALAYDAVVFCFFGEDLPSPRKFNLPDAPRPDISEGVRVGLKIAEIKSIAEDHARSFAGADPPPVSPAAAAPPTLAAAAGAAAAGEGATANNTDE